MDTLLNDIFHAQPYALLIIAGLVLIVIAVVGSIKTYIDPGKVGRISAGAVGGVLLIVGLVMSRSGAAAAPGAAVVPPVEAAAHVTGTPGQPTTACYVPGHWPVDLHKPMATGDACALPDGLKGSAVLASSTCAYTSGPKSGSSEQLKNLMYVGYSCSSPDKQSKGKVPPA